jgi:hypothetical protein
MLIYAKFMMIMRKTFRILDIIKTEMIKKSGHLLIHPGISYPIISSKVILDSLFQLIRLVTLWF